MKKFCAAFPEVKVHLLTIISLSLALFSGRLRPLLIFLLAAVLHELGHIMMALLLKVRVNKVTLLPFGLFAEMENLDQLPLLQEFLILIAGLVMYFPTLLLFSFHHQVGILSSITYQQAQAAALTILLFNLIPIYPLDGGRLLLLLTQLVCPVKKSYHLISIISALVLTLLILVNLAHPQLLLFGFLLVLQIEVLVTTRRRWLSFLLHRNKKKGRIKVHQQRDLYRPYLNFYVHGHQVLEEPVLIAELIRLKN